MFYFFIAPGFESFWNLLFLKKNGLGKIPQKQLNFGGGKKNPPKGGGGEMGREKNLRKKKTLILETRSYKVGKGGR